MSNSESIALLFPVFNHDPKIQVYIINCLSSCVNIVNPDKRLGKNTRYGMKDAALSAFRESIDFIYWFKN